MKTKKVKIFKLILISILIILLIKIFFSKNFLNLKVSDDYLFLKLLSNTKHNIDSEYTENEKEIKFKIDYKNINFKSINLAKTIDKNILVYDKIAPGSRGSFNIILNSNKNLKYKIQFKSINKKPINLNFQALKSEKVIAQTNTLEELSTKLDGYIYENQEINITINWYWNYENSEEEKDFQDTKDAENIKTYQFNILTYGEEIA